MNPQGWKRNRDYQERSKLTFHTGSDAWGSRVMSLSGRKQNLQAVTVLAGGDTSGLMFVHDAHLMVDYECVCGESDMT